MIYDHWEVGWVNISLWEPEKGPEKVKNGRFNMFSFFSWLERYMAHRLDERWVSMQKISSFRQKTAEIASGSCWYYKSSLPQSELVRAVFFRRLPFKSFDTRDVNMLVAWTRPEKRPWGPSGLKVFFRSSQLSRLKPLVITQIWRMIDVWGQICLLLCKLIWKHICPQTWKIPNDQYEAWLLAHPHCCSARVLGGQF